MLNLSIYCLAFFPALITPSYAQSDTATFAGVLAVSGGTVIIILIIWIAICCFCLQDERDFCKLKKRLGQRREQYRRYRQRQQIQRLLLQQSNRPRISVQPLGNALNSPTNLQPVGQEVVRPPQEPPVANTKRPSLSPQLFAPSQLPLPLPLPDPPTPSPPPPTSLQPPPLPLQPPPLQPPPLPLQPPPLQPPPLPLQPPPLQPPSLPLQPPPLPLQPPSPTLQPSSSTPSTLPPPLPPPLDPPPPPSSPPPLDPPPPPSAPPTLPLSPLDSSTEFQQPSPPRPRDGGEANRETESSNTPTRLTGDSDERNEVLNSIGGRRVHFNEVTGEEYLENSSVVVPVPVADLQQQPHGHGEDPTLREDFNIRSNTGGVGRWSPKFLREEEEVDVTLDESSSPPRYSWIFPEDEFQRDRSSREWWRISLGGRRGGENGERRRGGESGGRRGRERDDMAAFGQLNTWPQLTF